MEVAAVLYKRIYTAVCIYACALTHLYANAYACVDAYLRVSVNFCTCAYA